MMKEDWGGPLRKATAKKRLSTGPLGGGIKVMRGGWGKVLESLEGT